MKSDINKFLALKTALINEKAKIEARLTAINQVLGGDVAAAVTAAPVATRGGRRTFSAATKAKMKASQQARWAVKKGGVETAVAPAATKPPKRTMSEATKAKMRAAHQARWAKLKGNSAPATVTVSAAAPKKKRTMSAAGKANIRAAVKARWAKVEAAKAKTGK